MAQSPSSAALLSGHEMQSVAPSGNHIAASSSSQALAGGGGVGRCLRLGVTLYRISHIDDVNGCFAAEFRLHFHWEGTPSTTADNEHEDPPLRPEYAFLNALDEIQTIDEAPVEPTNSKKKGGANGALGRNSTWTASCRCRGRFAAQFQYQAFPMDRQAFPIIVRIPRVNKQGFSSVIVDPDRSTLRGSLDTATTLSPIPADFRMLDLQCAVTYKEPDKANFKPDFTVTVSLARRSTYYLTTMYVPLAFTVALSLNCFLVPLDQFADRTNIVITLVLCVVAFKFAIASRLPAISASTHFDKYVVFLYAFLMVVAMCNAISLTQFRSEPLFDFYCLVTLLCVFFFVNTGIVLWLLKHSRDARMASLAALSSL